MGHALKPWLHRARSTADPTRCDYNRANTGGIRREALDGVVNDDKIIRVRPCDRDLERHGQHGCPIHLLVHRVHQRCESSYLAEHGERSLFPFVLAYELSDVYFNSWNISSMLPVDAISDLPKEKR